MFKKVRRAIRSFEEKFEKRGYRSPLKKHRSLSQKVSLIAATYNVEPYIDEFLASVTSQTTGLHNLEVIIVDHGSTDRSGEIAKAWARRYPNTIRYIHQENKGAAEARNTGLDHATGEWVSFPDPDDILPRKWLARFDQEAKQKHSYAPLIITFPEHFYFDSTGKIRNGHPLREMYKSRVELRLCNLGNHILLSTKKTFVRRSAIKQPGLRFDHRVRPSFEDGHFLNSLMVEHPDCSLIRLPNPAYIYRKRDAGTSLIDGSKTNPLWYTEQLRFGYLDLINRSMDLNGNVPPFIQRTILYDIGFRFKHLLNHPERASHLTKDELDEFLQLLTEIFKHIDAKTIREMNLGGLHEEYKIGLLAMYKQTDQANDVVHIRQYDPDAQMLQFSCYTGGVAEPDVKIFVNGKPTRHLDPSRCISSFLDQPFVTEHRFWVPVSDDCELRTTISGRPARIKSNGHVPGDRVPLLKAIRSLRPQKSPKLPSEARRLREYATSEHVRARFDNCWVLMDRDDAADDNAEHLCRYMLQNGLAENTFFILREDSPDWERLAEDGFRLLPFGSDDHIAALINADILASSHANHPIFWPVSKNWIHDLTQYQYVFLQHGVTKDDLSGWLNSKPIKLFVTASQNEWHSIANHQSNYFFSEREAKLTGFPRHDSLQSRAQTRDTITVMPTWRRYLVGETLDASTVHAVRPDFIETEYAKTWQSLLNSDALRTLALKYDKEIVFCPHPHMAMYLDAFDLPNYIRRRDPRLPPSIQETFAAAAMMVTDYSSVAFECAYIDRPIAYYQFDRSEFFAGNHVYTKGYFDYSDDGFGPVAETQDQVLDAIEKALEGNEDPVYAQRRESFFAFRDGRCCERVYQEISRLLPDNG